MSLHPDLPKFAGFAVSLAMVARTQTLPRFRAGAAIFEKESAIFDPVTDADREAERAIAEKIAAAYPDHRIIGEEFGVRGGNGPYSWIIDPVDGTRAFVCGAPTWTTLIALHHDGRPLVGLIDQPFTDETWIASDGQTLYRRGPASQTCRTSGETLLAHARISTTDPRADVYFTGDDAARFAELLARSRIARFSLDAYAYGLLASGELDIVAETGLALHDLAALSSVVEGAGGVITNWLGEAPGTDERGEILASATPELHDAALSLLRA